MHDRRLEMTRVTQPEKVKTSGTGAKPGVGGGQDSQPCLTTLELDAAGAASNDVGECLSEAARAKGATVLGARIFGKANWDAPLPAGMVRLASRHCPERASTGAQAMLVSGDTLPRPVIHAGRQAGWRFSLPGAECAYLPALMPPCGTNCNAVVQARLWFEVLEGVLTSAGFEVWEIVRTWFHLDDILDWYDGFNHVRNAFFQRHGVFSGVVLASTGVGAANPLGYALCAGVLCMRPTGAASVTAVRSPLQRPALDYRSAFNCAVSVSLGSGSNLLMVSGTASIAPIGTTAHVGLPEEQVDLSMRVVQAILEDSGLDWRHVWRGIAYLRKPQAEQAFDRWLRAHRDGNLPPIVRPCCDICRSDLDFEIEVDAWQGEGDDS